MTSNTELNWGIHVLDTGFHRDNMAACYVVEDEGENGVEVAIVETGTKDTVPVIEAFLHDRGIDFEQVKYVIVTHVHLDHAGGAGLLMQMLPNAKLVVHEKGARHMINPAKLQAGATAVYGEEVFSKTYGDLLSIDESKILVPADEEVLTLGSRSFSFIDTPGHARHHFCVYDNKSQGFFTGDTFGLAYQELTTDKGPFIFPTTTPVQFDPDALKYSIKRLLSFQPQRMFLTHYGMVEQPDVLAEVLLARIDVLVDIATRNANHSDRINVIKEEVLVYFIEQLAEHNCTLSKSDQVNLLAMDATLNAQGLDVWLSLRD
ncbi:hypothetical protein A9Q81_16745 [Gammaproteobacteria bacterium 42_54_T18]|nr:hypothetical protein A9Q81_16745 [Gammaproteobacteria bacterium 42_54_T18]